MTTPTIKVWDQATGQWVYVASADSGGGGDGGGGTFTRYTHTQAVLAQVWTIPHGLGGHPAVSVEDAAGTVVHGTIQYLSDSTLTITFARSATGRANIL